MDVFKTHGAFSWSELMTPNPAAASEFYGKLFGWTIKPMEMGPEMGTYHVANIGEQGIAGICKPPPGSPAGMPPAWGVYVTVDNVEKVVADCTALGGKVCAPPMDIPGVGRFVVLQDPQGAVFNCIAYAPPAG